MVQSGANYHTDWRHIIMYGILFILSVMAVFHIVDYRLITLITALLIFIIDRSLFRKIDYSLLFTFVGFFIFIGNLQQMEIVRTFFSSLLGTNIVIVSALTSQFISNVPAAILLSRFTGDSGALLRGVSIGGLGTIIASLASVISFKFFTHDRPDEAASYLGVFTFWNIVFFAVLYGTNVLFY